MEIKADNREEFNRQLETCSFKKTLLTDSTICHKCAYELRECSSFVQRCKATLKAKKAGPKSRCTLCSMPTKKEHIFNLSKDNQTEQNTLEKIEKHLDYQTKNSVEKGATICLICCYMVDVLDDLKYICQETENRVNTAADKEINYTDFPKMKATVVSRKTTVTLSERTNSNLESESTSAARSKMPQRVSKRSQADAQRNHKLPVKSSSQSCEKCNNAVENGSAMYRFYKTGLTVCKNCWTTMDINRNSSKKQIQKTSVKTTPCTVFLKDVLTDESLQEEKVHKIVEDSQKNEVYVISDETSNDENKPARIIRKKATANAVSSDESKNRARKRAEKTVEQRESSASERKRPKKSQKKPVDNTESDAAKEKQTKRYTRTTKTTVVQVTSDSVESSPTKSDGQERSTRNTKNISTDNGQPSKKRKLDKTKAKANSVESSSQNETAEENENVEPAATEKVEDLVSSTSKVGKRKSVLASYSDVEVEHRRNRAKLKNILHGMPVPNVVPDTSYASSNEDSVPKRKKIRFSESDATKVERKQKNRRGAGPRSSKKSKPLEKTPASDEKDLGSSPDSEARTLEDAEHSEPDSNVAVTDEKYTCNECGTDYENKLIGMTHTLTHYKQPEIKLQKVEPPAGISEVPAGPSKDLIQTETIKITAVDDTKETVVDVEGDSDSEDEEVVLTSSNKETVEETKIGDDVSASENETERTKSAELPAEKIQEKNEQIDAAEPNPVESAEDSAKTDTAAEDTCKAKRRNREDCDSDSSSEAVIEEESPSSTKKKRSNSQKEASETENVQVEENEEETEKASEEKEEKDGGQSDLEEVEGRKAVAEKNDSEEDEGVILVDGEEMKIDNVKRRSKRKESRNIVIDDDEPEVPAKLDEDAAEVESETDIRIVDVDSPENSNETDTQLSNDVIQIADDEEEDEDSNEIQITTNDDDEPAESVKSQKKELNAVFDGATDTGVEIVEAENSQRNGTQKEAANDDSANAAAEVLKEVFDLATAEVQKRHSSSDEKNCNDDTETLENISREIENSSHNAAEKEKNIAN